MFQRWSTLLGAILFFISQVTILSGANKTDEDSQAINALSRRIAPPAGVDLDVTHISRTPRYHWDSVKKWPTPGEVITFTAHVINKGTQASGGFSYKWYIDGIEVHIGSSASLAPGDESTQTTTWSWQSGRHIVKFEVDPEGAITETAENNNAIEDATDALSVAFWVEESVYALFNSRENGAGTFSWEDWAQRTLNEMNRIFQRSMYPDAPRGVLTRVRLDKVTLVPDGTLFHLNYQHAPIETETDIQWGFSVDEYVPCGEHCFDLGWWIIHELGHYLLGRIDLYAFDVQDMDVHVLDDDGNPIVGTPALPNIAYDVVYYCSRMYDIMHSANPDSIYSDHTVYSINQEYPAGERFHHSRLYWLDLPAETKLRIMNNNGGPIPDVEVSIYHATPGDGSSGPYSQNFDNTVDISGTTDSEGLLSLGSQPFGNLQAVGTPGGTALIKLAHPITGEIVNTWMELVDMNLAYWRGESDLYLHDIYFPSGPNQLLLSENELVFHASTEINPVPMELQVDVIGGGVQYWKALAIGEPWLFTTPGADLEGGTSDYPSGPLTVIPRSIGLPVGIYSTELTVDGGAGTLDSPQSVNVTLHVVEPRKIYLPFIAMEYPQIPSLFVPGLEGDAEILNLNCVDWDKCRDSPTSNAIWHGLEASTVGVAYDEAGYRVHRIFLLFDTSSIPVEAQILDATLHIYSGRFQNGNTTFHVVRSTADAPLSYTDFGEIQFVSGGSTSSAEPYAWMAVGLNGIALDWINKGGTTTLALIHDFDLNNVRPTTYNDLMVAMGEHPTSSPLLAISYKMP